jgi:G3E family GTPase
VRSLNADAVILSCINSKINIDEIINAKKFDFERTSQSPAWLRAINAVDKLPETEEYGISSFVYSASRPFHPERVFAFVQTTLNQEDDADKPFGISYPRVLRSKGFFWLASRPTEILVWSQAGGLFQVAPGGRWLADSPAEVQALAREQGAEWDEDQQSGDRRQELVFIGTGMDAGLLTAVLDSCLLTDEEAATPSVVWADPFPETTVEAIAGDSDYAFVG